MPTLEGEPDLTLELLERAMQEPKVARVCPFRPDIPVAALCTTSNVAAFVRRVALGIACDTADTAES